MYLQFAIGIVWASFFQFLFFHLCTGLFHMVLFVFPFIPRKCLKLQLHAFVYRDIRLMGNGKHVIQIEWATKSHSCQFTMIWHSEGEHATVAGGIYGYQYMK